MKSNRFCISLSMLLIAAFFATNAFSLETKSSNASVRVVEDEIVLADPTVAPPKQWVIGGSGEMWYVWKNWIRWDNNKEYNHGMIKGFMPGGSAYLGYDKFTVSYSYRRGYWDGNHDSSNVPGATAYLSQHQAEHELTGRWLFNTSNKYINPYLLAGYNYTNRKEVMRVDPAHPHSYNSSTTSGIELTYHAPFVGTGLIVPFNERFGLRGDLRMMTLFGEWKRDDGLKESKVDFGGAVVGTFYANIWKGLNTQLGWKYQRLGIKEGGNLGATSKTGGFLMVGYTHKFDNFSNFFK